MPRWAEANRFSAMKETFYLIKLPQCNHWLSQDTNNAIYISWLRSKRYVRWWCTLLYLDHKISHQYTPPFFVQEWKYQATGLWSLWPIKIPHYHSLPVLHSKCQFVDSLFDSDEDRWTLNTVLRQARTPEKKGNLYTLEAGYFCHLPITARLTVTGFILVLIKSRALNPFLCSTPVPLVSIFIDSMSTSTFIWKKEMWE